MKRLVLHAQLNHCATNPKKVWENNFLRVSLLKRGVAHPVRLKTAYVVTENWYINKTEKTTIKSYYVNTKEQAMVWLKVLKTDVLYATTCQVTKKTLDTMFCRERHEGPICDIFHVQIFSLRRNVSMLSQ